MNIRLTAAALIAFALITTSANAHTRLSKYLHDTYKEDKDYKSFFTTVEGLKSKCDVCHKPGANKKAEGHGLNDFGKAYGEQFKSKDFQDADKAMKFDEATKVFKDAWEKSIAEKNADGKVFSDLIKEGKLPGKND